MAILPQTWLMDIKNDKFLEKENIYLLMTRGVWMALAGYSVASLFVGIHNAASCIALDWCLSHAFWSDAKLQYPECCNLLLSLTSSNLSSSSLPFSRALLCLCRQALMSSPKAWERQSVPPLSTLIQERLSACHWLAFFSVVVKAYPIYSDQRLKDCI